MKEGVGTAATKQALGQDLRKSFGSFPTFAAIALVDGPPAA
jgi:hypothetical protein